MRFTGFVKISRTLLEANIWEDGYDAALYFFLILHASHNFYGKLHPGQFCSSIVSIAKALGWSRNGTSKHINCLVQKGLITVSHDSDGTLFTVINWDEICQEKTKSFVSCSAQTMGPCDQEMNEDAQSMSKERSQNEHYQKYIYQEGPRTITFREKAFDIFWNQYPRHEDKSAARKAWMDMDVPVESLMSALVNAKNSKDWLQDGGKYIPKAMKWLDGKWEDYMVHDNREELSSWTEY